MTLTRRASVSSRNLDSLLPSHVRRDTGGVRMDRDSFDEDRIESATLLHICLLETIDEVAAA
jgi:hypothetical protein